MGGKAIAFCTMLLVVASVPLGSAVNFGPLGSGSDMPSLHASGIYLYDSNGLRVNLAGLNIMYGQGESVSTSDLQNAKALGFNGFRVNNVYWGLIQPYNESLTGIDVPFFSTGISTPLKGVHPALVPLDNVVNMAVQENMYVAIALMAWTGYYVPPAWAFPSYSHAGGNAVWGGQSSASRAAYATMINGTAAREQTGLVNTWQFIANRYRGIPNVLFELLNEPFVVNTSIAGNFYKTFNERIISGIESVESQSHVKIVEFLRDQYDNEIVSGSMDLSKANVVWASHLYAPNSYVPTGSYYHDAFTWHGVHFPAGNGNGSTFIAWKLIRVASQAHAWLRPWMNTEFSRQVTQPYWMNWFNVVMTTMQEQNVSGWQYYCYSSASNNDPGYNLDDPTVKQEVMPVLEPFMSDYDTSTSTATTLVSSSTSTSTSTLSNSTSTSASTTLTSSSTNVTTASATTSTSSTTTTMNSTAQSFTSTLTSTTRNTTLTTNTSSSISTSSTQSTIMLTSTSTSTSSATPSITISTTSIKTSTSSTTPAVSSSTQNTLPVTTVITSSSTSATPTTTTSSSTMEPSSVTTPITAVTTTSSSTQTSTVTTPTSTGVITSSSTSSTPTTSSFTSSTPTVATTTSSSTTSTMTTTSSSKSQTSIQTTVITASCFVSSQGGTWQQTPCGVAPTLPSPPQPPPISTTTSSQSASSSMFRTTTSTSLDIVTAAHTSIAIYTSTTSSTVHSQSIAITSSNNSTIGQMVPPGTSLSLSYSWFSVLQFSLGCLLMKPIRPSLHIRSKLPRLASQEPKQIRP